MAIDYIVSCFAITAFLSRTIVNNNMEVKDKVKMESEYRLLYSTKELSDFIYEHFGDEKMLMTYPRLKIETTDGEIIHVRDLYKDIKSYYFKII